MIIEIFEIQTDDIKMYNAINKIRNSSMTNGILFSFFSFINKGFSFLLLIILANYIAPKEYGYLGLFATLLMVLGFFIAMSTEGYMSVAYFKEGKQGLRKTFSFIFYLSILTSIFFCIIIFCGGKRLSTMLELPESILLITVLIAFFTVFTNVNLDYLRLNLQIKSYCLISCGNALMNFFLSILFVHYCNLGWIGRVWAQACCYCLFGLGALLFFFHKNMFTRVPVYYCKHVLYWGIPLIPHLASNFLRQGCDRYIVNYYQTMYDVGLFNFALNLTNIIVMVGAGFNQSNSVLLYQILGDNNLSNCAKRQKISKIIKNNLLICICYSVLIIIGLNIFIPIVLPKYSGSLIYFSILGIYGFLQCVYFIYSNFLFFYDKTRAIMYITFFSSLLHLLLSLSLTRYSLLFTCFVYVLSQLIIVFILRNHSKKIINKNIQCKLNTNEIR